MRKLMKTRDMLHNLIINVTGVSTLLCWLTCLLMAIALYMTFLYAPTDNVIGDAQRIFYFHCASSWVALLSLVIVLIASLKYLRTPLRKWDILAHASVEIGTLFGAITLITGPLWAQPVLTVWWTWNFRLTTTLVLWLMYIGYLLLRKYVTGMRGAKYAAIWGMIALFDVPLIYGLIHWPRTLHPATEIVRNSRADLDSAMLVTLFVSVSACICLFAYLLQHRLTIFRMGDELAELRRILNEREQDMRGDVLIENENFIIEDYTFMEYRKS